MFFWVVCYQDTPKKTAFTVIFLSSIIMLWCWMKGKKGRSSKKQQCISSIRAALREEAPPPPQPLCMKAPVCYNKFFSL